jgi:DNA-directed RNA polymerase subunit omega
MLAPNKILSYNQNRRDDKMIYPSIDKLLNQVGSKYLLVNIVSKRAKEMKETDHYQMKDNEYVSKKEIGKALEEVSKDLIHMK